MHVDDSILLEILLYLEGSFVPPRTVSHHRSAVWYISTIAPCFSYQT
jgi:hypothetical protein